MRAITIAIVIRASRSDIPTFLSLERLGKVQRFKGLQREAFTSHRTSVVHFQAVELDVCGIAHKRFIRRMHHLATSQSLHDGLSSCRQLRGRLEEKFISSKPGLDDLDQFGPLGLGNGKVCSEVEQRFLLYLAANSSALDQANGSIGFVGGAALSGEPFAKLSKVDDFIPQKG